MLKIEGLHKRFVENEVLKGINLRVEKGKVVVLLGPSGSGKTTLLRCINQLETAEQGRVTLAGKQVDLATISKDERAYLRQHSAMVFQQYNLFRNKTILQNVTEALRTVQKHSKREAFEIAEPLLHSVGLWEKRDDYPSSLSGGQQQRVGIVRALALRPKLLLFDEPTSALDPEWVGEILSIMTKIAKSGITMLVVTHEMGFARDVADKVVFMDNGEVVEEGPPAEIFSKPKQARTKQFLVRYLQTIEYYI